MNKPKEEPEIKFGPLLVETNDCVPKYRVLILGDPDSIMLALGQTEATLEQIAESYRRTSRLMKVSSK